MSLKKAAECLKRNKSFLITTHTNLEGDALGSEIAIYRLLKALGKRAIIVNDDSLPYGYDFLADTKNVKKFQPGKIDERFDCLALVDCSDLRRCGQVGKINLERKIILNIDHHISNENFGNVNWVEPKTSSCSEMIYKLYKEMRIAFDKESAAALYAGMLTDTGSFRYSNTNSFTHLAVAELMKYGLEPSRIYRQIYQNIPLSEVQLLTKVLPTIKFSASGRVAWFQIERRLFAKRQLLFDVSEYILSFGRAVKGVEVVVLFKENLGGKGEIRVNFRSQGKVDVNKIARFFGGGGHKTASGATIRGKLEQVRKKVLAKIREAINKI
ncbi:MAG: bifunctional oligoribonuclease/PAP phosphatase NrnA [Candidatus Omnitrophota bacterium]|jgi:phosphoesterase RecJ-like protein